MSKLWTFDELTILGEVIDRGLTSGQVVRANYLPARTRSAIIIQARRQGWNFGRPRSSKSIQLPTLRKAALTQHITFQIKPEAKRLLTEHSYLTNRHMTAILNSIIIDALGEKE